MTVEQLNRQYRQVPEELKKLKRWVCFKIEKRNGENTKIPVNSVFGTNASCSNDTTWSTFKMAVNGCAKYGCDGLGFMLGNGIFGVDLDDSNWKRHKKGEITIEEYEEQKDIFENLKQEFVVGLNSYTEYSPSGKGVHIICYGTLPFGRRRKGNVEMYDSGRFFTFTGNAINCVPIQERTSEIIPLWEKYVDDGKEIKPLKKIEEIEKPGFEMDDEELIQKILKSNQGAKFQTLFDGDYSSYVNQYTGEPDHSAADHALCSILAFWTGNNMEQMDRIFRNSGLMREKWDEFRGSQKYGEKTLLRAISSNEEIYTPQTETKQITLNKPQIKETKYINEETGEVTSEFTPIMSLDENGEPVFANKLIFKRYHLDDTGNANKFFDYFGEYFRYNVTDKVFMYWTGKTWIKDDKDIIKKYANELIEISRKEIASIDKNIADYQNAGKITELEMEKKYKEAYTKNLTRMSNKAGKEAMISEFKALKNIAVSSDEFNKQEYYLNTESGVVDLETGKVMPFNPEFMISKNTNCKISYEEPTEWINFLNSIFYRGDDEEDIKETEEIIHFIKTALGYTLSGDTSEQGLFLLFGGGSNGKSTFTEQIAYMMGDYADSVASNILMQQKQQNDSAKFSIAKLKNARYVSTGETDDGERLAEAQIKAWTGGESINAQFKFGNEFSYKPQFKIWMSTNNKPIIRGTDHGIWRRIFLVPFLRRFTDDQKDKYLPKKLRAESDKILGWCIKGFQEFRAQKGLILPNCLKKELNVYKNQMDVVAKFLENQTVSSPGGEVSAKILWQNYKMWAKDNEEYLLRQSKFEEQILNKNYIVQKKKGEKYFVGLRLLNDKSYDFR